MGAYTTAGIRERAVGIVANPTEAASDGLGVIATGTPQWYQRLGRQAYFVRDFLDLV
jgi:hypothetical protein